MSEKLRILVTGFGPFPGAPYNPTQPLVARLTRLRRPAFTDVELSSHIFPVTYRAVDRELPLALQKHRPHALLMFGLAGRTGYLRVETRARNAVTMLWPDAAQTRARKGSIADGADAQRFGPHTAKLLRAAEGTGLDARASRDAGSYLCNYLSWRAIEAVDAGNGPRLAAFVHIPPLARGGAPRRKGFPRITLEELVDAGEAMLLEMVRLARSEPRRVGKAKRAHHCVRRIEMVGTAQTRLCPPYRPRPHPTLTLPRTIAAFRPRLHHAAPHFRDTYECANAAICIARGPPWT